MLLFTNCVLVCVKLARKKERKKGKKEMKRKKNTQISVKIDEYPNRVHNDQKTTRVCSTVGRC